MRSLGDGIKEFLIVSGARRRRTHVDSIGMDRTLEKTFSAEVAEVSQRTQRKNYPWRPPRNLRDLCAKNLFYFYPLRRNRAWEAVATACVLRLRFAQDEDHC